MCTIYTVIHNSAPDISRQNSLLPMPESPDQPLSRAIQLEIEGNLEQAARLYQQVLGSDPQNVKALYHYGMLHLTAGHPPQAINFLEKATKLAPESAAGWLGLGYAYRQQGLTEKARQAIDAALRLNQDDPHIWIESGHLHTDQADTAMAIAAYQQALSLKPACVEAYYSLSFLHQTGDYQFSRLQLQWLNQAAEKPQSLSPQEQALLYFTLGRIHHRAGDYDTAFASFERANQTQKATQKDWERFRVSDKQALLDASRKVFSASGKRSTGKPASSSALRPVFIIGMPRSGSTLLESCLARHPQIAAAGELPIIKNVARQQLLKATGKNYPEFMPTLPAQLAAITAKHVMQQFAERISSKANNAPPIKDSPSRVIDKMPTNFEYLGLINRLFPDAAIIHLYRDPMDTLWSCYQQNLAARYSNDFSDLEGQYRCYRQFMQLWRDIGIPMLELDYETLVTDFEPSVKQVVEYLGLEWDERCLNTTDTSAAISTASRMQVRQPVHTGAINAWKKYAGQLAPLRERLADFYPDSN